MKEKAHCDFVDRPEVPVFSEKSLFLPSEGQIVSLARTFRWH